MGEGRDGIDSCSRSKDCIAARKVDSAKRSEDGVKVDSATSSEDGIKVDSATSSKMAMRKNWPHGPKRTQSAESNEEQQKLKRADLQHGPRQ